MITLACNVFKVDYVIADFKAVYYTEYKNHAHFFWSDWIFKIKLLLWNI